jgi:hypothetical protein
LSERINIFQTLVRSNPDQHNRALPRVQSLHITPGDPSSRTSRLPASPPARSLPATKPATLLTPALSPSSSNFSSCSCSSFWMAVLLSCRVFFFLLENGFVLDSLKIYCFG